MLKFGVEAVRALAIFLTAVLQISGWVLIVNGENSRHVWTSSVPSFGWRMVVCSNVSIGYGVVMVLITAGGMWAVCKNHYILLLAYFVSLVVLAIALFIYSLYLIVEAKSDTGHYFVQLNAILDSIRPGVDLDTIQLNFHCCGINKYTDYMFLTPMRTINGSLSNESLHNPREHGDKILSQNWRSDLSLGRADENFILKRRRAATPRYVLKDLRWHSIRKLLLKNFVLLEEAVNKVLEKNFKGTGALKDKTPEWTEHMLQSLWQSVRPTVLWFVRRSGSSFRWYFGSGWDQILFRAIEGRLPQSCCKNPSHNCLGSSTDTWMIGCRYRLSWFLKHSNIELSMILVIYFVLDIVAMLIVYVLLIGLREKYYY